MLTGPIRTFDMKAHRSWGDSIQWSKAPTRIVGWMDDKPRKDDMIKSAMKSGRVGLYRVVSVELQSDPPDMFFATVEFAGYEGEL